jgi:hypothetical protein
MLNAKEMMNLDNKSLFSSQNRNLIIDLYQYYFYNGFHSILTEKIVRLLLSFLMIFLFNFIINCIDYNALLNPLNLSEQLHKDKHKSIYDYIYLSNWFPRNPYLIICFSVYCIYLASLISNIINSIKKFAKIRIIYNSILAINDYRLKFITWDAVIAEICKRLGADELLDISGINIYTIINRICYQSNLVVSLIRARYITIPNYSKFLEWNYIFCIVEPMTIPAIHSYHTNYTNTSLTPLSPETLSDTLDDIHHLTNKQIYNRYDATQEPLLELSIQEQVAYYENHRPQFHNQSTTSDYLDNISSNTQSPATQSSATQSPVTSNVLSHNSNTNLNQTNTFDFTSNSIIRNNRFNSILYNTLTIDTRKPTRTINEYLQKVNYRINLVIGLNLIAMPFMIVILGLYLFIKYGEKLYGNPGILFQRRINISTLWRLRYYNELPNLFRERITRIEANMDKIINAYQSSIKQIITRFLLFLIGSVFFVLLILSFIATEEFSQLEVVPSHNVIWFLGICGTLILILNRISNTNNFLLTKCEQIRAFDALREDLITIYPEINKIEDREYLVSLINEIYKPRLVNMFYELVNLIIAPYYLLRWKKQVATRANDILELIENHYQLGNVCRHSIFTNRDDILRNPHMLLSLKEFKMNHEWDLPDIINLDFALSNSCLLQKSSF